MNKQPTQISKLRDIILLMVFVAMSGCRDVIAEHFMKRSDEVSPIFVIFGFCMAAFLLSAILHFTHTRGETRSNSSLRSFLPDLIQLNIATAASYLLTIYAIWSQLGAAYSSFLDYALTPVLMTIFAGIFLRESITKMNGFVILASVVGLALLFASESPEVPLNTPNQTAGILAISGAAASGAWMYALNKKLVNEKIHLGSLLATRMILTAVLSLVYLLATSAIPEASTMALFLGYSIVFFALPMWLLLIAFRNTSLSSFSIWLFLIPVSTLLAALPFGLVHINSQKLLGALIIFVPVVASQILAFRKGRLNVS